MSLWWYLLVVFGAGVIGGVVNALISDNGFFMPMKKKTKKGTIVRPGVFGNMFIGGIAAAASWGSYGPFAASHIMGSQAGSVTSTGLTLGSLIGAVLVGVGGSRWLTNEVDKRILKATASEAAARGPDEELGESIYFASPAKALQMAEGTTPPAD